MEVGDEAIIGVNVKNTGEKQDTYTVVLKVDGVITKTLDVTLVGGISQQITFSVVLHEVGSHIIMIDNLTGKLQVTTD